MVVGCICTNCIKNYVGLQSVQIVPPPSPTLEFSATHIYSFVLDTRTISIIESKSINIECVWTLIDITLTIGQMKIVRESRTWFRIQYYLCMRADFSSSRNSFLGFFSLTFLFFFVSFGALMIWLCVQRYANLFSFLFF